MSFSISLKTSKHLTPAALADPEMARGDASTAA